MATGPSRRPDVFCISSEVEDAVFAVADCVDDLGDAGEAESFLAGVAGACHSE